MNKDLNKEVIIDFGFKQMPTDLTRYKLINTRTFKKGIYTIILYDSETTKYMQSFGKTNLVIAREDRHRTPDLNGNFRQRCIFEGTINTKEEFETLLKQLNI